jgi:hypothetical protein
LTDKNGVWVDNPLMMVDVIADIIQTWLEDNLVGDIYDYAIKTAEIYSNREKFESQVIELFTDFSNKRKEAFEAQLTTETV